MAKLTVRYDGSTIVNQADISGDSAVIGYNGQTIATCAAGQTKNLQCASKFMQSNVTVGNKTLQCANKMMTGDVAVIVEGATPPAEPYTILEYIETDGNSYLETPVYFFQTSSDFIGLEFSINGEKYHEYEAEYVENQQGTIIAAQYDDLYVDFGVYPEYYGEPLVFCEYDYRGYMGVEFYLDDVCSIHVATVPVPGGVMFIADRDIAIGSKSVATIASLVDERFRLLGADPSFTCPPGMRLHAFHAEISGDTPMTFKAARWNSDGAIGMYCEELDIFLGNQGYGEFIPGPEL